MKIINEFPPNIEEIKNSLGNLVSIDNVFCMGDVVYNPSGKEIPDDVRWHELIHQRQQGNNPIGWWRRYLNDAEFRYSQELEAYSYQYSYIHKLLPNKYLVYALDELATNLSSRYNTGKTKSQALTAIKRFAKQIK